MESILKLRRKNYGTARPSRRATVCDLKFRAATVSGVGMTSLMLMLAIGVLSVGNSMAQTNDRDHAQLLESGRADKIAEPASSDQIKIVSYNIRWRSGEELQQITRWLKEPNALHQPILIGL